MPLIGLLVKKAIELSEAITQDNFGENTQQNQLEKLLEQAKDTAFGKYYGFAAILKSEHLFEQYQKQVPIFRNGGKNKCTFIFSPFLS